MAIPTTFIIQVIAVVSVPLLFAGLLYNRLSLRQHFQWKHAKMVALMSLAPVLVVLATEGLLSGWRAVFGVLVVMMGALLLGNNAE